MPRRYYNYLRQFQPLHQFSTVGFWILGAGFFLTAAYLLATFRKPMDAPEIPGAAVRSNGRRSLRQPRTISISIRS